MSDVAVSGNDNLVIVAGRDVYLPAAPTTPPTGDDCRNLANLLGHVRQTWITDVLEHSVHEAALLEPGMRNEAGAVEHPWERVLETVGEPGRVLSPEKTIGQVFEDVGRMLLILGEPGSGKTTTLLTLARECIERSEHDSASPVPVVLSLSSWKDSGKSIHNWLVSELSKRYYVGKRLARDWLTRHRLLLLLDGLDEVVDERREACVEALHVFQEEYGLPGLAICCRSKEYRALPVRLKLGGAVSLLPLAQRQIDAYLDAAGPRFAELRAALARNTDLRTLAESPLMLSIMTLAFRDAPAAALTFEEASGLAALRDQIFTTYVNRMFVRRGRAAGEFARERTEAWLRWLASGMLRRGESIFAVKLLQPAWLTGLQLFIYAFVSRVVGAASLGIGIGLVIISVVPLRMLGEGLAAAPTHPESASATVKAILAAGASLGLLSGLLCFPFDYLRLRLTGRFELPSFVRGVGAIPLFILYAFFTMCAFFLFFLLSIILLDSTRGPFIAALGLLVFFVYLLIFPIFFGIKRGRGLAERDIGLFGAFVWRWRLALTSAALGGLITLGLTFVTNGKHFMGMAIGVFFGLLFGGWRIAVPPIETWTKRLLRSSALNPVRGFVYVSLVFVLMSLLAIPFLKMEAASNSVRLWQGVRSAVPFGIVAFLWFGAIDFVMHTSLRLVLLLTGAVPLRLHRMIAYTIHLGFLQRAGGGYIFIHRLLLEHFAARPHAANPADRLA